MKSPERYRADAAALLLATKDTDGEIGVCAQLLAAADIASTSVRALLKAVGEPGRCRGCGAPIWWVAHRNGKRAPYTAAGLNHFADCQKAEHFRAMQHNREGGTDG